MSTAASITVKKNDGSTDVVYALVEGASGVNPARWKATALGAIPTTQPELRVTSKNVKNSDKTKVIGTFMYPYHVVNSTTGVTSVEKRVMARIEFNGDQSIPQATSDEAASQFCNLVASAAFKTMCKEGAAAV